MSNIQSANGTQPAPHAQHHQFEQSEPEERRRRQYKECPSKAQYASKEREKELEEEEILGKRGEKEGKGWFSEAGLLIQCAGSVYKELLPLDTPIAFTFCFSFQKG